MKMPWTKPMKKLRIFLGLIFALTLTNAIMFLLNMSINGLIPTTLTMVLIALIAIFGFIIGYKVI